MSTTTTATSIDPTAPRYECDSGCGMLTFTWQPGDYKGGRLGTATFGQFVNKPIQVYDAKIIKDPVTQREVARDWGFQAQDGSFLGRMYVTSPRHSYIRFAHFRPNDQWPQVSFTVPVPDPLDSRGTIDKIP
ncbi:MAG: hypothetical protein ACJ754_10510 [Pyrinomonadaceae bacterium]